MGIESNNAAEVEGLVQGIQMAKEYNWTPLIVQGDSQVVIHMETNVIVTSKDILNVFY